MVLVQGSDDYEFLYGGDGDGNLWLFTPPTLSGRNDDMLSGTISTPIESYVVTPWMNFAKILGKPDWERTRVIPRYLKMYVSGESQGGIEEVSLTGEYWVDFNQEKVIATFDLTFTTHAWPELRPYEKTIYYGGKVGTFRWIKWKFSNDREVERYSIHKMVFGFKPITIAQRGTRGRARLGCGIQVPCRYILEWGQGPASQPACRGSGVSRQQAVRPPRRA